MNLVVTEIFYTLQGEGPFIGYPSVFIRLGGCIEPFCPWCDTEYAWHEFTELGTDEIMTEIRHYSCKDVVITGGEPLLQWESGLRDLHKKLVLSGYRIFYETSGKAGIPSITDATVILSPKYIDWKWHILQSDIQRADYLKFVAEDEASLEEIHRLIQECSIPNDIIYIMPQGKTRHEQLSRMEPVFTFCREYGYRMTPRLHVLVFDNKRGI